MAREYQHLMADVSQEAGSSVGNILEHMSLEHPAMVIRLASMCRLLSEKWGLTAIGPEVSMRALELACKMEGITEAAIMTAVADYTFQLQDLAEKR